MVVHSFGFQGTLAHGRERAVERESAVLLAPIVALDQKEPQGFIQDFLLGGEKSATLGLKRDFFRHF